MRETFSPYPERFEGWNYFRPFQRTVGLKILWNTFKKSAYQREPEITLQIDVFLTPPPTKCDADKFTMDYPKYVSGWNGNVCKRHARVSLWTVCKSQRSSFKGILLENWGNEVGCSLIVKKVDYVLEKLNYSPTGSKRCVKAQCPLV